MAKCRVPSGETSRLLEVFIQDASQTDGRGRTGLAYNTAGLTCAYHRNRDAAAVVVSLVSMTVGTFTSGGFKEVDAATMPGVYQLCLPDAAYAEGAASVVCLLTGASTMVATPLEIQILEGEPPNTIIVWINDIDRTSLCSALRWSSTINGIGTASFTVKDPDGLFIPQDDDLVEIEVAGTIRWAGTVANPAGTSHLVHRGVGTFCNVTCQDHNQKLQRSISNGIIAPQSLRDTLEFLCDGVLTAQAITLDPTQAEGPTLTTITSPWLTSEALVDYLATQSGWVRRVDQDNQLKMWAVGSVSSGVTLSAANANVRAAAYDLQRFDYRSAQWVVFGPNGVLHVGDSWTGDGVTQVFLQHYRNYPTRPATVTVGATTYPVGIYGVDVMEWTWQESGFALVQSGTPVGVGVAISTDYDTLFPSFVYVEGDEWPTRPWVRVDFAPHILHWDEATAYAEALIRQHQPRLKLPQVTTYLETIAVGSTVVVDFPVLDIDAVTCFVRATETRVIPTGDEVLLETTLDLIGGTDDVPANSATDLWKRIIFGESASSGAVGTTAGGLAPASGTGLTEIPETAITDGALLDRLAAVETHTAHGVHRYEAGGTGANVLAVRNTAAGTTNYVELRLGTDEADIVGVLEAFSSTWTTTAHNHQSGMTVQAVLDGGLSLVASHASGDVRIYSRAALAATFGASQLLTLTGGLTVGGAFRCASVTNDTGLASGTYTPTLTGVSNVASLTAFACMYQRIGLIVMVSGMLSVDPTAATTATGIGISLPIASMLWDSTQCAGVGSSNSIVETGAIYADYANLRAHLEFPSIGTAAAHLVMFTFTYQVI